MALDRQSIERKDFPVGRRGYDPDAVDAHLAALADEITEFKRSSRRRADTLASSASEQVRAIVEAAETSAAEITREAEREAREIRDEANAEALAARDQANDQAKEYVATVSESTHSMLARLDAMQQEINSLIESLRAGGNRLTSDLQLLESDLAGVSEAAVPRPRFQAEEAEPAAVAAEDEGFGEGDATPFYDPDAESTVPFEPESGGDYGVAGGGGEGDLSYPNTAAEETDDAEGARLIALNMALNGTPREETARYLSENFQLSDAGGLLDEVYASVDG